MTVVRNYLATLGFLTRLGPAARDPDLAAGVPYFPVVGATLGLVLVAPLFLGLFAGHPFAGGWFYAVAGLALTRGLHLDGFADVADAWGSLAEGERFFTIMKDSRIGAFGGMALAVALGGQIALGGSLLEGGRLGVLLLAPMAGRACAVALMYRCRALVRPGLGSLCLPGATPMVTLTALAMTAVMALVLTGVVTTLWTALCCAVVLTVLTALARRQGGVNGDFIGAAIVACELSTLAAGLLGY